MGELAALGAALAWAVGFLIVRSAPPAVPASHLNAIRLLAPCIIFPAVMLLLGWQDRFFDMTWQNFAGLAASVIAGIGIGDVLLFSAMRAVGVVRAYTIGGVFPLFGFLYAAVWLDEQVGLTALAGTALVVAGAALVTARTSTEKALPRASAWEYRRGLALCVLVAMMWGADMVFLKIGSSGTHPVVANSFRMPLAALAINTLAWRVTGRLPLARLRPRVAGTLLLSGALGLGVGSVLHLTALQSIGAARAGAIGAFSPVFAMLLAVVFLKERPGWPARAGVVIAAAGVGLLSIG